ncbi:MAG: class I SAM-dependent methyltransferase [Acidobacteria bacterium]|nr:class I SAM-dependent methyltransferase [Acidobacteriota bacterium]
MSDHEQYFTTRFAEDARRARMWRHLGKYLARFVPPEGAVLELGAGYCYFINGVQARRRVAVDLSETVRRAAAPGVEAIVGDALAALRTMPSAQFDFVFASNFLEHFEWPVLDAMAIELRRVLVPGGRLGLVQPNFRLQPGRYFDDYTHRTIFTDVSLADWLAANGLRVTRVIPKFLPLTVKSRFGGLSFLVPLYLRSPWRPMAGQMLVVAERPPA